MPIKTRDLALDTLLLMVAATFVLMGLVALLTGALGILRASLYLLLVTNTALSVLLCGIGLLAALQGWSSVRRLAGVGLAALALYGLAGGGISLPGSEPRLALPMAVGLLPISLCLWLGLSHRPARRLWRGTGLLLCSVGVIGLAWLPMHRPDSSTSLPAASPIMALLLILLFGAAMVAAGRRADGEGLKLSRLTVLAALAGVALSSLSWFLLGWQQQSALH